MVRQSRPSAGSEHRPVSVPAGGPVRHAAAVPLWLEQ